jgi:hypothetical protein
MDPTNGGASVFIESAINQMNAFIGHLPGILAGMLILVVGWLAARLVRRVVRRLGAATNRLLASTFPSGVFSGTRMSSLVVTLFSETAFWAMLLIAVSAAARFAALGTVSQWLDRITGYLPNLVAGISIVVVGYFLSVFTREQLAPTSEESTAPEPLHARIAQGVIVLIAFIVGLDQVGIDVALLIALTVAAAAAILIGLVVAFTTGARSHISNLVGARTARANLSAGMTIRVGDIEGEIVELNATLVALDTDIGRVLVPGKMLDESVITVLNPDNAEEGQA